MKNLPYISINMAMSLDGKITTVSREPAQFSSAEDKKLLLALRARADAVMAGGGTVAADTMSMGIPDRHLQRAREKKGKPAHPIRVIVSGTLKSLSPKLKVFKKRLSPLVIFCSSRAPEARRRLFAHLAVVVVCGEDGVDLGKVCYFLGRYYGVRHLHVEGGAGLNGALLDSDLVDELDLTVANVFFGGRRAPTIVEGEGRPLIREALAMRLVSVRHSGGEVYLRYVRRGDPRTTK